MTDDGLNDWSGSLEARETDRSTPGRHLVWGRAAQLRCTPVERSNGGSSGGEVFEIKNKCKPHRVLTVQELDRQAEELGLTGFNLLDAWFASRTLGQRTFGNPGPAPLVRV